MAVAIPPRPITSVPRPSRQTARQLPPPRLVSSQSAPAKPEPRESLHSVDLEEDNGDRQSQTNAVERSGARPAMPTLAGPVDEHDPLDFVLEALRSVKCERAVEAASVCLATCVRAVGCRAAIAHLWDEREQDFVVVYVLASTPGLLLNSRHGKNDPLLAEAFTKRSPRVANYDGSRPVLARHALITGAWSVLTAPVMDDDVALGALELIDPLDGSCFDDRAVAAAHHAAERLADLLHGVGTGGIGKIIVPLDE